MNVPQRGSFVAALLALATMLPLLPGVGLADDDNDNKRDKQQKQVQQETAQQGIVPAGGSPDLQLTGGDFNAPDNFRVIRFTVKNIGTAPSSATRRGSGSHLSSRADAALPRDPTSTEDRAAEAGGERDPAAGREHRCDLLVGRRVRRARGVRAGRRPRGPEPANNAISDKQVCAALPVGGRARADVLPAPAARLSHRAFRTGRDRDLLEGPRWRGALWGRFPTRPRAWRRGSGINWIPTSSGGRTSGSTWTPPAGAGGWLVPDRRDAHVQGDTLCEL